MCVCEGYREVFCPPAEVVWWWWGMLLLLLLLLLGSWSVEARTRTRAASTHIVIMHMHHEQRQEQNGKVFPPLSFFPSFQGWVLDGMDIEMLSCYCLCSLSGTSATLSRSLPSEQFLYSPSLLMTVTYLQLSPLLLLILLLPHPPIRYPMSIDPSVLLLVHSVVGCF